MIGMPRATPATASEPRKCPATMVSTMNVMDCTSAYTMQDGMTFLTVLAESTLDCNSVFKCIPPVVVPRVLCASERFSKA